MIGLDDPGSEDFAEKDEFAFRRYDVAPVLAMSLMVLVLAGVFSWMLLGLRDASLGPDAPAVRFDGDPAPEHSAPPGGRAADDSPRTVSERADFAQLSLGDEVEVEAGPPPQTRRTSERGASERSSELSARLTALQLGPVEDRVLSLQMSVNALDREGRTWLAWVAEAEGGLQGIASDPTLLSEYRAAVPETQEQRLTLDASAAERRQAELDELASLVKAARDRGGVASEEVRQLREAVANMENEVTPALTRLRAANRLTVSLRERGAEVDDRAASPSLAEALRRLSIGEAAAAAAEQKAVVDEANEQAASIIREAEEQAARIRAEAAAAVKLQRAEETAARRRLEVKFDASRREIERVLRPFLADGYAQPDGRRNVHGATLGPMSFSGLQAAGALSPDRAGMERLMYLASQKNDRYDGAFPQYIGSDYAWEKMTDKPYVKRAQDLLREFGPLLVEKKMLAP